MYCSGVSSGRSEDTVELDTYNMDDFWAQVPLKNMVYTSCDAFVTGPSHLSSKWSCIAMQTIFM